MPPRPKSAYDGLMSLCYTSYTDAYDKSYPYQRVAIRLYYTLGMTNIHAPNIPRLLCGYLPFHEKNENILRRILENLSALSSPIKSPRPRSYDGPGFTFPPQNIQKIKELLAELVSLLLDERMTVYIILVLKRISLLHVWQSSVYSEKSWAEIDQALYEPPTSVAETTSSSLRGTLFEVSRKLGTNIDIIINWIHLFEKSPVSKEEQFIFDAVEDHDYDAINARLRADHNALYFFSSFCSPEKLLPYRSAYKFFRDFWTPTSKTDRELMEGASRWLQIEYKKRRYRDMRWKARSARNAYVPLGGIC
jgi:hypothetical protein